MDKKGKTPLSAAGGQILIGAVILVVVLVLLAPILVRWAQRESKTSVQGQQSVTAFNLAETAVERAHWKLKSATSTWRAASQGNVLAGYNFDATYTDVTGGSYRIGLSSGPGPDQVTVRAEARDTSTGQKRALRAIFENTALAGPLLANGIITYAGAFECHWGPIFAHNNIGISGNAATEYFPRKFSSQVVTGSGGQERDTNGLNPPNTDNVEWWSDYDVPDLPLLDFLTIRSSAQASGTLNFRTNTGASGAGKCTGWAGHGTCDSGGATPASHTGTPSSYHFFDSHHHALSKNNFLWYWDPGIDVVLSGDMGGGGCHRLGIVGAVIVRGNLTMDSGDCYSYVGPVPPNAWKEYTRLHPATFDTATADQYPADNGFQTNRLTFNHGSESWTGGPPSANTDVGIQGFVYTGGNLTINSVADVAGTIWAVGNVVNNDVGERVLVFYEGNNPNIPLLNVVLTRESWDEVAPSTAPWL